MVGGGGETVQNRQLMDCSRAAQTVTAEKFHPLKCVLIFKK
jgi:hypothetical protein